MRQREGVAEDYQMELPMICSVSITFIPILDKLPKRGTRTPIIMTDKMGGIQNYFNDRELVSECLPEPVAPPPPPPPEPEPVVIDRIIIPSVIPDSTGNNFNNAALVAQDRKINELKRQGAFFESQRNKDQEELLWKIYQDNPTQENADALRS